MSLDAQVATDEGVIVREHLGSQETIQRLRVDVIEAYKLAPVIEARANDAQQPFKLLCRVLWCPEGLVGLHWEEVPILLREIDFLPDAPYRVKVFKIKMRNLCSAALEWYGVIQFS